MPDSREVLDRELRYHEQLYSGFAQKHFARPAVRALRAHMVARLLRLMPDPKSARVLSLVEYQVRERLRKEGTKLRDVYAGQPGRQTARPSAELLLGVMKTISVSAVEVNGNGARATVNSNASGDASVRSLVKARARTL